MFETHALCVDYYLPSAYLGSMKKLKLLFFPTILALAFGLMLSCAKSSSDDSKSEDTDTSTSSAVTVSGQVQKGPYVQGTEITVRELDSSMTPTGNTFTGTIDDNTGSFSIKGTLTNKIVELAAVGYYFNEVSGSLSSAPLTLSALSDLTDSSSVNVNLMTHLEKKRVEYLMDNSKMTFAAAKTQAQTEILKFFNIDNVTLSNSETLDISKSGDGNAVLLAISAILQSDKTEAELTELLSTINTDIRTDGTLDSTTTKATIVTAMEYLQSRHANIRSNIESRYSSLGISATIPAFESYAFKLDIIAPTVVSYSPTIIDNTSSISVTFSEPMDNSTLSTNTSDTTCSGTIQVSSDNFSSCVQMSTPTNSSNTITYDNGTTSDDNSTIFASNSDKTFTVKPSNNLSNVTSYQTRIKSSVKDVAGNSLADDYSVSIGVDPYNLITGSITVKIGGLNYGGTSGDYWCNPLNVCSCGISFSGGGSGNGSAVFISSISGTYPPFSYEWYFDGTKESTLDNLSISYSAGNHKGKLYITDNQSNRIYAGGVGCSAELTEEFIYFN
jgi:hypothetical protein